MENENLKVVLGNKNNGLGLLDTVIDVNNIQLGSGNVSQVNDNIIKYSDVQNNIDYFIRYDFSKDMFIDITAEDIKYIKSII